jgi:hypothetical protein
MHFTTGSRDNKTFWAERGLRGAERARARRVDRGAHRGHAWTWSETCPLSTRGGMRGVRLVRKEGREVSA